MADHDVDDLDPSDPRHPDAPLAPMRADERADARQRTGKTVAAAIREYEEDPATPSAFEPMPEQPLREPDPGDGP